MIIYFIFIRIKFKKTKSTHMFNDKIRHWITTEFFRTMKTNFFLIKFGKNILKISQISFCNIPQQFKDAHDFGPLVNPVRATAWKL